MIRPGNGTQVCRTQTRRNGISSILFHKSYVFMVMAILSIYQVQGRVYRPSRTPPPPQSGARQVIMIGILESRCGKKMKIFC